MVASSPTSSFHLSSTPSTLNATVSNKNCGTEGEFDGGKTAGELTPKQNPEYRPMFEKGVPPGYTRRLIKRRYMDPEEAAKDPDLTSAHVPDSVWNLKLYGPKIKVVTTEGLPPGWVLVDRIASF